SVEDAAARRRHVLQRQAADQTIVGVDVHLAVRLGGGDAAVGGLGEGADDVPDVGAALVRDGGGVADIEDVRDAAVVGRNDQVVASVGLDADHAIRRDDAGAVGLLLKETLDRRAMVDEDSPTVWVVGDVFVAAVIPVEA